MGSCSEGGPGKTVGAVGKALGVYILVSKPPCDLIRRGTAQRWKWQRDPKEKGGLHERNEIET